MAQAPRQSQSPAPSTEGFDLLRPFRMLWNFTAGTIGGALDGMARWGSRGAMAGGAIGLVYGIMNPVVYSAGQLVGGIGIVTGVGGGLLVGALAAIAFGGAIGALTGGFTRASRLQAREDAALVARAQTRARSGYTGPNLDRISDSNFDRQLQQNQENESYWRDHVTSQGQGHGRGF
jgi:hypothetical protein